ncbi:aa3-type cytochrome c oxidase subunit IV [Paenochrobactrum glaciei]|uniref:Aa3-type cytochrome c oxidase subunit IV n=1 Tax=Paenochrobactrum glaciei TaxID=486407 RepID=A0ABN1FW75_9HYPH
MANTANNTSLELGATMDYPEHEQTYNGFVSLVKWGTTALVSLLIAMAFGFFVGGFISGAVVFFLVMIAAWFIL